MKKGLLILLCLFSLNTLTYASFPVSETTQTEVVAENIELPTYVRS